MHAFLKGGSSLSAPGKDKLLKEGKKEEKRKRPTPWVEKYRPQTVDDVAHQDEVVAVLKKSLQRSDLPNLLFYGPPGTGKTSTILAASRELFGPMYRDRTLELNSSDERGINVIRDKVKKFAQLAASGTRPDGKPCPPFKIVILDECDSMTSPAQSALRRTMERETKTTRFCLICNYVSRIIEPITSRCAKFRFKPLGSAIMETRLREICQKENVTFEDGVIETILETSEGDMRKAITSLQSAARLKMDEAITVGDVLEITGVVPDKEMEKIMTACYSDSYEKLDTTIKEVISEGYSGMQVLTQLHDIVVSKTEISDKQKSAICERISVCDKRLMDGADEYLQIMDLCTVMMQQICHGQK